MQGEMMIYEEIPYVEKPISRLILGTANEPFRTGADQSLFLDQALAAGITTIDTGRVYEKSEEVLGRWLESRNAYDQVVLISKCAHPSVPLWRKRVNEKEIRKDFEISSQKLRTKYIDIYLLHRDDTDKEVGEIVEIMNALYAEGKIGAYGGSNWTHQRIEMANEYAYKYNLVPFAVSSPHYSLAHQVQDPWGGGCVTLTGPENEEARAWYQRTRMPVFAYSSLANGLFSGRAKGNDPAGIKNMLSKEAMKGYGYPENFERLQRCEELARVKNCTVSQLALAWLFRQELNVFAIVSSTSMERMKDNIKALEIDLSEEELRYLGDSSFMRSQK